ncbi:hypothetical protein B0H19DRAFT_1072558 [Mycena capillaripes]|nr:hypothetical protein B0H19DRAFT_1072558 [Mycena capillaripes]
MAQVSARQTYRKYHLFTLIWGDAKSMMEALSATPMSLTQSFLPSLRSHSLPSHAVTSIGKTRDAHGTQCGPVPTVIPMNWTFNNTPEMAAFIAAYFPVFPANLLPAFCSCDWVKWHGIGFFCLSPPWNKINLSEPDFIFKRCFRIPGGPRPLERGATSVPIRARRCFLTYYGRRFAFDEAFLRHLIARGSSSTKCASGRTSSTIRTIGADYVAATPDLSRRSRLGVADLNRVESSQSIDSSRLESTSSRSHASCTVRRKNAIGDKLGT